MRQGGEWQWNAISFDLPPCIKGRILSTPIQLYGVKEDSMNWKASKDGEFTVASMYTLARSKEEHSDGFKGSWIWKIDSLPRICHFIWLCHHNSVPIREVIASRGIECEAVCPLCNFDAETIIHMLRDCPFAAAFWRKIGVPSDLKSTFSLDILKWLKTNCVYNLLIKMTGCLWKTMFTFAVWSLWKHRNRVVFKNTTLNLKLHDSCLKQAIEYMYCVGKSFRTIHVRYSHVKWNIPMEGWCKLNSDGASLGNPGRAGGGGLIQDHRGA